MARASPAKQSAAKGIPAQTLNSSSLNEYYHQSVQPRSHLDPIPQISTSKRKFNLPLKPKKLVLPTPGGQFAQFNNAQMAQTSIDHEKTLKQTYSSLERSKQNTRRSHKGRSTSRTSKPQFDHLYSTDQEQSVFERLMNLLAAHYCFIPVLLGESALRASNRALAAPNQATLGERTVLLQRNKVKFQNNYECPILRNMTYFVEISMLKSRIFFLVVDESNASRRFDHSVAHQNMTVLNNNSNTIFMHTLWKKQIQSIFMRVFNFKRSMLALAARPD